MVKLEIKTQESDKLIEDNLKKNRFSYVEVVGTDVEGDCLLTTLILPTKLVKSVEEYSRDKGQDFKYSVESFEIKDFQLTYFKNGEMLVINDSKVLHVSEIFINDFISMYVGTRNALFSILDVEEYGLNTLELDFYNKYLTTRVKYNHLKDDVYDYLNGKKYDS